MPNKDSFKIQENHKELISLYNLMFLKIETYKFKYID